MAKAKVINVDVRNDGSVVAYYDTGSTKAFKSVEATPKTVKTWLDANAPAPVTVQATETGIVLVAPAEVVENIMEEAVQLPATVPTPKRHTEPADSWRDMEPRLVWTLPAIPYMFAWWAVIAALVGVRALGLAVEATVEGVRIFRQVAVFVAAWWKQSTGFRTELLRECRISEWEVA